MRLVVGVGAITMVVEVIGATVTVPEAGTTPLTGMAIGTGADIVIGTVVIVLRVRIRPNRPVRTGVV